MFIHDQYDLPYEMTRGLRTVCTDENEVQAVMSSPMRHGYRQELIRRVKEGQTMAQAINCGEKAEEAYDTPERHGKVIRY